MKRIEDVKIFSLMDAVKRLGKLKPANGGAEKMYSYGGIFSAARRKWPDMRPVAHGLYILLEDVPLADAALDARKSGNKCAGKPFETVNIGPIQVVGIKEYADHFGLSLSAVRKIYYADGSPLQEYFFEWSGGYALTDDQVKELVAWVKKFGKRPHRAKFKRSKSHRSGRGPLNRAVTETAVKITGEEGKDA